MSKILTLVIPTYNMERYLDQCLTSLIVENLELRSQIEVLIINDGSKDRSSEIAHSYQEKYPNLFRVVDKENGNYGSCVNRGLKEAEGKYIKILDADDSFDTIEFERYLKKLERSNVDLILTPFYYVNENRKRLNRVKYDLKENEVLSFDQVTPALLKQSIQMHAVTYKTSCVRSINYKQTEGISYTDQEWVFTPLSAVNSIVYFNTPVYLYLWGRAGQTMSGENVKKCMLHNVLCAKKILTDYINFPSFDEAKQKIIDYKAMRTLEGPYFSYLVRFPELDRKELIAYENFLNELNPGFLEKADSFVLKGTSFHYIREWRKNKNFTVPKYILKWSFLLTRIAGKMNRIIQNLPSLCHFSKIN